MTGRTQCFNTYLLAALLVFTTGCESPKGGDSADAKTAGKSESKSKDKAKTGKKEEFTLIRLHVQVNPDGTQFTIPATVYRASPVNLNVQATPVVMEANVVHAELIEDLSGYSIRIFTDRSGALLLENATTTYRGSRMVVLAEWGTDKQAERRWVSAVFIGNRITDGVFSFTPDATREEADAIVRGLNNMAVKLRNTGK